MANTPYYTKAETNAIEANLRRQYNYGASSYQGYLAIADTPTLDGWYWATQIGTYTNAGGLVTVANKINMIEKSGATFTLNAIDVPVTPVVDGLTSTSTTSALSANQGRVLNEKMATKPDLVVGKNLFNKDSITAGSLMDNAGVITALADHNISDFIPVIPSTQYVCNPQARFTTYFDANKAVVSGGSNASINGFTTPSNVFFVKITVTDSALNTFQLELGATSTTYEAYSKSVQPVQLNLKEYTKTNDLKIITDYDTRLKANLEQSKNLFNKDTTTDNFYINTANGTLLALGTLFASDFIPVNELTQYFFNTGRNYTAFYDINKVFISGSLNAFPLTTPAKTKYIRVSGDMGQKSLMQLEVGASATGYEKYFLKFDNINNDKIPALKLSKNLFIVETSIANSFVNWNDGTIAGSQPAHIASDFIPVVAGSVYSCNGIPYKAFYDVNKTFISGSQSGAYPVTIPAGCAFIRITINTSQKYTAQFELGSTQTSYARGGYNSTYPYYTDEPEVVKKMVTIGDSITAGNNWQPKIATKLNLTHTNLGISGTALSGNTDGGTVGDGYWTTQRIAQIPTDTDIIILNGGINDYARNIVIGSLDSTNTNEYYGALNKWAERVIARVPNAKIFIATTTYGEYLTFSESNGYANAGGNTSKEYATAMKNFAYKFGFPLIDFNGAGGVNKWNRPALIPDGLHPATVYAERMSNLAIQVLEKLI